MAPEVTLETAREAFARQAWGAARAAYAALGTDATLSLDDIDRHAIAAHLVGEESESREALTRGYREAVRLDDVTKAARFAFWLGHRLFFTGELGQANGWFARARTLLSERGADCVEWGFLMIPTAVEQIEEDAAAACNTCIQAQAIGRRFADPDLLSMAGHGRGRALVRMGLTDEGMAVLDEVMVAVTNGEVSPMVMGDVYCGVLEACHEVFDLRRAREWTSALSRWCEDQPDLVPYRGPCLVHRVELMRLRGDWQDALDEAQKACDWLSMPASPEGPGDALYQMGELYRLRGEYTAADAAYRQASRMGRPPDPGLALLWLARGQTDAACSAVERALAETGLSRVRRSELLGACVEILLARGEIDAAAKSTAELTALATELEAPLLRALADRATGSVLIAHGDAPAALAPLRRAWTAYKELDVPYEAARVRLLISSGYRALGDSESAAMEADAARWVFERIGAIPDLARLDAETAPPAGSPSIGLTPREIEVLCLIAGGETNKAIAAALVISEHTVARHVQNMLQKLGFSSRASLAAFAAEQGLSHTPSGQN